jgi:hypothetical protein
LGGCQTGRGLVPVQMWQQLLCAYSQLSSPVWSELRYPQREGLHARKSVGDLRGRLLLPLRYALIPCAGRQRRARHCTAARAGLSGIASRCYPCQPASPQFSTQSTPAWRICVCQCTRASASERAADAHESAVGAEHLEREAALGLLDLKDIRCFRRADARLPCAHPPQRPRLP